MAACPQFASALFGARKVLMALALGVAAAGLGYTPAAYAGHTPDLFADLAAAVSDAVVNISATQDLRRERRE